MAGGVGGEAATSPRSTRGRTSREAHLRRRDAGHRHGRRDDRDGPGRRRDRGQAVARWRVRSPGCSKHTGSTVEWDRDCLGLSPTPDMLSHHSVSGYAFSMICDDIDADGAIYCPNRPRQTGHLRLGIPSAGRGIYGRNNNAQGYLGGEYGAFPWGALFDLQPWGQLGSVDYGVYGETRLDLQLLRPCTEDWGALGASG